MLYDILYYFIIINYKHSLKFLLIILFLKEKNYYMIFYINE